MDLLAEEVDLICKEDVSALKLTKIEALSSKLVRAGHDGVNISGDIFPEFDPVSDDRVQRFFLLRLERQSRDFILPSLQIF